MKTNEFTIPAKISRELRFAFASDIHGARNEPILAEIERLAPDAVLVGGDCIHSKLSFERGLDFLKESARRRPTFCALGNHETRFGADIVGLMRGTGATLLDNEKAHFEDIEIGGLTSGYGFGQSQKRTKAAPAPDLDFLARFAEGDGFKLLLSHHPEYFEQYIEPLQIDLTLSGHAHGGQWRFFGRGVFAPGQGLLPKYTSGSCFDGRLIVGRGLGNPYLVPRLFNPTELLLIRLVPTE